VQVAAERLRLGRGERLVQGHRLFGRRQRLGEVAPTGRADLGERTQRPTELLAVAHRVGRRQEAVQVDGLLGGGQRGVEPADLGRGQPQVVQRAGQLGLEHHRSKAGQPAVAVSGLLGEFAGLVQIAPGGEHQAEVVQRGGKAVFETDRVAPGQHPVQRVVRVQPAQRQDGLLGRRGGRVVLAELGAGQAEVAQCNGHPDPQPDPVHHPQPAVPGDELAVQLDRAGQGGRGLLAAGQPGGPQPPGGQRQRKLGVGGRLMDWAEEEARANGAKTMVLNSQLGAQAFYGSCGYEPEGETFTWDGTLWEQSRCGLQVSCVNQVCATPHGKYIARMCASRTTSDAGTFCMSAPTPTCVDVPFDYPTMATVEGVLKEIMQLKNDPEVRDIGRERDFFDRLPPDSIDPDVARQYNEYCLAVGLRPRPLDKRGHPEEPPEWTDPEEGLDPDR